jgi:Mrp family chromosome partitioning ATPase
MLDFAALPQFSPDPAVLEENHVVAFDSRDMRSRPFNLMRTRFTKQLELQKMKLVGITSPAPTTGKSLLSVNLAAAIARLKDTPVILADLDLRRGSVAETLGLSFECGITDYLGGQATRIEDMLVAVEGLPLAILASRSTSEDSTVLLSGQRYAHLMQWLRAQAQNAIVIVDLPPVFANDDAMILMESLDGYLMVVDSGKTTAKQVRNAVDLLKPAPALGSVLNRYKGGMLDSYGYSSGSGAYGRYYEK